MAHVRKEVVIEAEPQAVWSALADWGALHERLVSRDEERMRLAWTVFEALRAPQRRRPGLRRA
ncbi:MAG TPA: hypothetical protein VEB65_12680, partial [Solirubrobacterales bacterium]|nr:hypothetical protein [Solirubrobacterales bacterium]